MYYLIYNLLHASVNIILFWKTWVVFLLSFITFLVLILLDKVYRPNISQYPFNVFLDKIKQFSVDKEKLYIKNYDYTRVKSRDTVNHILNRKVHPCYTRFKADFRLIEFRRFHCTSVLYYPPLLNSAYPSKLHPLLYGSVVLRYKNAFYLGLTAVTLRFSGNSKKTIEKAVNTIAHDVKPVQSAATHVPVTPKKDSSSGLKQEQPPVKKTSNFDKKPEIISGNIKSIQDQIPSQTNPGMKWYQNFTSTEKKPNTVTSSSPKTQPEANSKVQTDLITRGLIKEDTYNKKSVAILLEDGSSKFIGNSNSGYKLSHLGNAYREHVVPPQKPLEDSFFVQDVSIDKFKIMIPVPTTEKTFIEESHNKHLIVIFNPFDKEYYSVAELTSKKTAEFFANQQFKTFQDEKQTGNYVVTNEKNTQHIVYYHIPQKVNSESVCFAKWGTEYITNVPEKSKEKLLLTVIKATELGVLHQHDPEGLTTKQGEDMCDAYDAITSKNKKHPISKEQAMLNKKNEENQKQKNKAKNLGKNNEEQD